MLNTRIEEGCPLRILQDETPTQPQAQLMMVTVPPGVSPGQLMQVLDPAGGAYTVGGPAGTGNGSAVGSAMVDRGNRERSNSEHQN